MSSSLTRRELLRWSALGIGAVALAACAPKEPTAAPAAPKEEEPAAAPVAKEEAKPAAAGAITLRFMTRQGDGGLHHREFGQRYANESEGRIKVEFEDTNWNDIPKKLELQLVSGTMVDLAVMSTRYYPYLARRGSFFELDDLVAEQNLDLDRWFNIDWFRRWSDGKLTGLGGAAGLSNILVFCNLDWIRDAWGKEPTDDWTMDDFVDCMQACVRAKGEGYFGANVAKGGNVEAECWVRNWGGAYIDAEGVTSLFAEEKCQDAIKWLREQLANGNFPGREDAAEGDIPMFFSQKQACVISNPGASEGMVQGAADNGFELGVFLAPKGPSAQETPPRRGFGPYANCFSVYAKTKYPSEAFGLMLRVLSVESFRWINEQTGRQPGALLDTWYDPEVAGRYPWFPKVADIMKACREPYPIPGNTRYTEWQDVGDNEIQPLIYGEVEYTQANIDLVNDHLQEILDLPMPGA